jgi:hypothetical protein
MIVEKVEKTLKSAIERFSKEANLTESQIQLLIKVIENEPCYFVCHEYQINRQIKYNEIMNVRLDILGQGMLVGHFIGNYLTGYAVSKEKNLADLSAMICKDGDRLRFFLYEKQDFIEELTLDDIIQT